MEKPPPDPSRRRLQELLEIPERQRTETDWDEINELEIALTPANRAVAPERSVHRKPAVASGDQLKARETGQGRRLLKKPRKRLPKGGAAP
ncbi:MAG TPA: hypothetical protein VHB01_00110 [Nitrosospira sp.]|jgi:hypothetical protein|nr:hypothetical protein [Nitrosospira sp.]